MEMAKDNTEEETSQIVQQQIGSNQQVGAKQPISARINLDTAENINSLTEESETRQVLLQSVGDSKPLAYINPFKLKRDLDEIVGEIEGVEHRRNGAILVTTKTMAQVKTLIDTKVLPHTHRYQ